MNFMTLEQLACPLSNYDSVISQVLLIVPAGAYLNANQIFQTAPASLKCSNYIVSFSLFHCDRKSFVGARFLLLSVPSEIVVVLKS